MLVKSVSLEKIYEKDPKLRKEDVKSLLEWSDRQPHLPKVTELQALLFLHSCNYRIEVAKTTLDKFFTVRTLCPEIFQFSLDDPLVKDAVDNVAVVAPLTKKALDGCTVLYAKLLDYRPEKYHLNSQVKVSDFSNLLEVSLNGPGQGVRFILDMEGMMVGHMARLNLTTSKNYAYYFQEAIPLRVKGIHVIHVPFFIDKVMMLFKPFLKKEFYDMLHFHTEWESLYKFIPQEALPSHLGGQGPSVASMKATMHERFYENSDLFTEYNKQLVDERKRPDKAKQAENIFGVQGSFKKLDID